MSDLREAAQAVVDAYASRFRVEGRSRDFGPIDDEVEALRRALATPQPAAAAWMPIETAPTEGEFLVYVPSDVWLSVHSARRYADGTTVVSGLMEDDDEPTHWMPSPPEPQ